MNKSIIPNIKISPKAHYEHQHSNAHLNKFVHSYHIVIENQSNEIVQLLSRHWYIVNALGEVREVQGLGVIGKQPVIGPGERYEYDSWSPLDTPLGKMYGTFTMLSLSDEQTFEVAIPEFALNADHLSN
ncbi:Co2+/Mg2+ efflux protein ApaG [Portibacter marinus]|uniref:Co2+/Mg2+ efflux protein ApaG n=1 Tax=Portibacter marinus TaxID=2898660 RepID=UPI001F1E95C5|nr:Co2+/Mg2+ efflux protein ApaG [Portibacter marinus]